MAVIRRHIDPRTGDYVLERGRPQQSDGIMGSVVLALLTPHGSCPVAPELGNRLLSLGKITPNIERTAGDLIREALRHLIERGDIRNVEVLAEASGSRLTVQVGYTDRGGRRRQLTLSPGDA